MDPLSPQVKAKVQHRRFPPILAPTYQGRVTSYDSLFLTLNSSQTEYLWLLLKYSTLFSVTLFYSLLLELSYVSHIYLPLFYSSSFCLSLRPQFSCSFFKDSFLDALRFSLNDIPRDCHCILFGELINEVLGRENNTENTAFV